MFAGNPTHVGFVALLCIISAWAALDDPRLLDPDVSLSNLRVYGHPKLLRLEHMVSGLWLCNTQQLRRELQTLYTSKLSGRDGSETLWYKLSWALFLLLTEYIPALFMLGKTVRAMYWTRQSINSGHLGRQFLIHALTLLRILEGPKVTEYQRGISIALHLWNTQVHDTVPAGCMVEEALEASLSRLQSAVRQELTSHTVPHFSSLYGSLGPVSTDLRDLTDAGLSEIFSSSVGYQVAQADAAHH